MVVRPSNHLYFPHNIYTSTTIAAAHHGTLEMGLICNYLVAGISQPKQLLVTEYVNSCSTIEHSHAMQVFKGERLQIDTRASPTPPPEMTGSAIPDQLFEEHSTVSHAMQLGSGPGTMDTPSDPLAVSTTIEPTSTTSSALVHLSTPPGSTILCISLGSIFVALFLLLALIFCLKRHSCEKKEMEKAKFARVLATPITTKRAKDTEK